MRYLAKISYDGSKYNGFQRLNDLKSIQKTLEDTLMIMFKKKIVVKGAGRTDALVHAYMQCIHFDLDNNISPQKLKYALNRLLPGSIAVNDITLVDDNFHARYSVKEKCYEYKIYMGEKNAFLENYAYFLPQKLDIKKMRKAGNLFVGRHDFRNFVSGKRGNYESIISSLKIKKDGNFLDIEIKGKSFYKYMVRKIVGALIDVGVGRCDILDIKKALDDYEKKSQFFVAPPMGLYLVWIKY